MTTYELPPEPPGGAGVKDRNGNLWTSTNVGWLGHAEDGRRIWETWNGLLVRLGPLALIEPDPWPTDELIVADWIAGAAKGHGLAYLNGHEYIAIESGHVLREGRDTLTNVVPVTVVPVAEWRTVCDAACIRGSDEGDRDYWARVGKQAVYAVTATDALGVYL